MNSRLFGGFNPAKWNTYETDAPHHFIKLHGESKLILVFPLNYIISLSFNYIFHSDYITIFPYLHDLLGFNSSKSKASKASKALPEVREQLHASGAPTTRQGQELQGLLGNNAGDVSLG